MDTLHGTPVEWKQVLTDLIFSDNVYHRKMDKYYAKHGCIYTTRTARSWLKS